MLTIAQQDDLRFDGIDRIVTDAVLNFDAPFVVRHAAVFRPLFRAQRLLPAPEGEVAVETYRGWPIAWETGYGYSAQTSCHADDCLGWCDTLSEIREQIDDEIADRRRSYGSHFHEDTPALDDFLHRIEMDA